MRVALALLVVAACGGGTATPDADISDLVYAPCPAAERVGGFEIELAADYTAVQGQVLDGVLPSLVPSVVQSEGDCRLVEAPRHTCEPACAVGSECNADLECVPYPVAHDVGTVSVVGLQVAVDMPPRPPNYFYSNPGTLPHPGFDPGAAIALSAGGGDFDAFTLRGWGIAPLAVGSTEVTVEADLPVAIDWTPPPEVGPARVLLTLNINGHGVVGARLECEIEDSGAATIPVGLVNALLDLGVSGFPTLVVTRSSADSTAIDPGCADLRVRSSVVIDVTIPGLISCNDPQDCPDGQTCMTDLTCG